MMISPPRISGLVSDGGLLLVISELDPVISILAFTISLLDPTVIILATVISA